jgi:class 3 adenylate cyclase
MVRDLPTGVVTLLFTDVEGSTRLLHSLGDDYGEALQEHRRRLRAVFADHEGIEVDTQGDAFFVAFARASNAVAAATDGQRTLADGPIRVRMGLHTGEPRLTEEGYVGLDVHKGARIAAVGHGGQASAASFGRRRRQQPTRQLATRLEWLPFQTTTLAVLQEVPFEWPNAIEPERTPSVAVVAIVLVATTSG